MTRRYCFISSRVYDMPGDDCPECGPGGRTHRAIDDQTRCGHYVLCQKYRTHSDDSHGHPCEREANHEGECRATGCAR